MTRELEYCKAMLYKYFNPEKSEEDSETIHKLVLSPDFRAVMVKVFINN
jgi:hypothetical protein